MPVGHLQIGDHQVVLVLEEHLERFDSIGSELTGELLPGEGPPHQLSHLELIVDDQRQRLPFEHQTVLTLRAHNRPLGKFYLTV